MTRHRDMRIFELCFGLGLSQDARSSLETIHASGLYGRDDETESMRAFVMEAIRRAIADGIIAR